MSSSYSYSSYNGLLLSNSSYHLISTDSDYNLSKHIILDSLHSHNISSSLVRFPHNINIGSFKYSYSFKKYNMLSTIYIINYGDFQDSKSGYSFSSTDYIIKNRLYTKINSKFSSSIDFKYINSTIDQYTSNAIAIKLNLFYHYHRFLIQNFIDNYGLIINSYTSFKEQLPYSYGFKVMYLPKYLDSILSFQYNFFDSYRVFNLSYELFLFGHSSIHIGFNSLANDLYYNDFYTDFFTGISFGISTGYKDYSINLAAKNLGPIGLISSLTITKSIN